MFLLQDNAPPSTVMNGWGVLNTLLNILGPALIIFVQWFVAKGVKAKAVEQAVSVNNNLDKIHDAVNGGLQDAKNEAIAAKNEVVALRKQLHSAGIAPLLPDTQSDR